MTTEQWALAVIALATLIMAFVQIGIIVFGARLAKRVESLIERTERDVQPLIARASAVMDQDVRPILARVGAISDEASRVVTVAGAQVDRIDRLVTDISARVDQTIHAAQKAMVAPAREGVALAAAVKATVGTMRELRRQQREGRLGVDSDDALFIG